ncbi:glycoside hydrolase domain-containing protein, partial [Planctomycetota bacterium]
MAARLCLILAVLAGLTLLFSACQQQSGSRQTPKTRPEKNDPASAPEAPTVPAAENPAAVPAGPAPIPAPVQKVSDVWCLPEYYRIDPVSGEVAEWGHKPVTAEFKAKNSVYDGEANTVNLTGMKGETLAFQIMIEGDHTDVTLQSAGLPGGAAFFYEGYLQWFDGAKLRYTADVPVPLDWIGGTFAVKAVPEQLPAIQGKKMQAVWVDVKIPRTAAAGTIAGTVTVKAGGAGLSVIPVKVTVIDAELSEQPSYLNAMICYSTFGRKYPQKERDAYVQMQAHRQSIHEVPYSSQRGFALSDAVPVTTLTPAFKRYDEFRQKAQKMNSAERDAYSYDPEIATLKNPKNHTVRGKDLEQRLKELMPLHDQLLKASREEYKKNGAGVTDWTEFDKRYGPLFDGSAFEDGIPLVSFELPFNFNWPALLDRFGIMDPKQSEMYEDIWIKVAQDFLKHANEKGWTRTHFFVYFNPKDRGNNLVMWKGDEPCEMHDFLGHKYFNEL